jgi:hypothetical protein
LGWKAVSGIFVTMAGLSGHPRERQYQPRWFQSHSIVLLHTYVERGSYSILYSM